MLDINKATVRACPRFWTSAKRRSGLRDFWTNVIPCTLSSVITCAIKTPPADECHDLSFRLGRSTSGTREDWVCKRSSALSRRLFPFHLSSCNPSSGVRSYRRRQGRRRLQVVYCIVVRTVPFHSGSCILSSRARVGIRTGRLLDGRTSGDVDAVFGIRQTRALSEAFPRAVEGH